MTHKELVERGAAWLERQNCKIVIDDRMAAKTLYKERPDVMGWRNGKSILIECKTSKADFYCDAKKPFRVDPDKGMGDYRFYMCPPDVIKIENLPEGWGLLYVTEKTVRQVHGVPKKWNTRKKPPFVGNKVCENLVLVSALRRLSLRGYLPEIYEGPINADGTPKVRKPRRARRASTTHLKLAA